MREDVAAALSDLLPVWNALAPEERSTLLRGARLGRFSAGDFVQGGGLGCAGVIFVREGSLRAYMTSESGRQITLFRVGRGGCCVLAASCILPMVTFDISLDAAEDALLAIVDPQRFSEAMAADARLEAFAYRQATERLSDVMWVMQQVLFMSFDERLAVFLLDEASRTGSPVLRLTHDEIARHLGSAREVVSRMLKYFSSEGLVALSRGSVEVVDKGRLRALASRA